MRVRRIDFGTLAAPVRRSDGSIVVEARLARTGVQVYTRTDGTKVREYRPKSEVFDAKSLETFRGRPVTNNHPPAMLDATNATEYAVGAVLETPRQDGQWMVASLSIYDATTVKAMEAGKVQVSNGYDADIVDEPGTTPEGEHYDAIQTKIEGNHVAIVQNARAGKDAAVRMDALAQTDDAPHRSDVMNLEQALAALAKAQQELGATTARADSAEKERDAQKARADAATAERDSHKERADKSDKARTDAESAQPARIKARVALEGGARSILDAEDCKDLDAKSDREIKLAVIKHVTDADCDVDAKGTKRSDAYVDARYDAAVERASESSDTFREANELIEEGRTRADGDSGLAAEQKKTDKARADMLAHNRSGGRQSTDANK